MKLSAFHVMAKYKMKSRGMVGKQKPGFTEMETWELNYRDF